jgi:hypothetical protein
MLAFDQETLTTEQEIPTQLRSRNNNDELDSEKLSRAATPDPDEDDLDDDELDLDDEDELDLDDDDLEDDDLEDDVVPGYDEDLDADDDLDDEDEDLKDPIAEADGDLFEDADEPNEIPEREEADNEDLGAPSEQEYTTPQEGNDASFSEQTDVTPPRTHEFPSVGSPQTDFSSRNQGRTTGRMVGHEPGTEGI